MIARICRFCRLYGFIDWDGVLGILGVFVDWWFFGILWVFVICGFWDEGFMGLKMGDWPLWFSRCGYAGMFEVLEWCFW